MVLSLEEGTVQDFAKAIDGAKYVVWSAGAGGKGGPERTTAVDLKVRSRSAGLDGAVLYGEGQAAVKVFDAIESLNIKPRLLVVSAIDVRDDSQPAPSHYVRRAFFHVPEAT